MANLNKNEIIVRSIDPIGLFGGGFVGAEDLNLVLNRVKSVVAADGGAKVLTESGHIPDAVIGDFDSLSASTQAKIPTERLFPIREQDSTDFDKALRSTQCPLILGAGFLGGRLDHQLTVLNTLVRRQDQACILLGEHEVVFHAPPHIRLPVDPGDVVSLFPLRPVTGRSTGLEWPIDGLKFDPAGQVGTSNRALAEVELHMDAPGLLIMIPRSALDPLMQVFLSEQTGQWPAREE
ncbi:MULTISPECIES: thiamine diphosphokinase [unclassified Ruegeria]|uniref:thiamine diphosphokinase n=1 Tax=unclassified Ruegeria TaxID=2625375 RepID=UPI001487DFB1|nr:MULTISPECIES: thiamine diphosphokinase [unclassified Ruegeria]NOD33846.1 thiamine diphosphokinase [Ruegeria sp. HKCCD7296]NOE40479.1 thiamine diphosphokinase [Ruegeria sp. HKCCD7319]